MGLLCILVNDLVMKQMLYCVCFSMFIPDIDIIGCLSRWQTEQIYVNETAQLFGTYRKNSSNGTTISIKKRGGLSLAWQDAKVLAGWCPVPSGDVALAGSEEKASE